MPSETFERVLRGFDPEAVTARLEELAKDKADLAQQLAASVEENTQQRLRMVAQVEEASAEAAVVLGHARSEATRIRETAIKESDGIIDSARESADNIEAEALALREEARALKEQAASRAEEIRDAAEEEARSILSTARTRAESLTTEASETLEKATKRSEEISAELRLQKAELDRLESEVRDAADSYALRVHRDADAYARTSEQRTSDLERQAEEILAEARRTANDITARATSSARKNLEESLRLVNLMFSDVSGSLAEVTRIRQVLGDQVERLSVTESSVHEITDLPQVQESPDDDSESDED